MGWLSDKLFGKRKTMDLNKIQGYLDPTQSLINSQGNLVGEQLGISQTLRDPNSSLNQMMRNMILQRGYDSGEQIGQSIGRTGAMTGASSAQTMMQQRMAMKDSLAGTNNQANEMFMNRFDQGTSLLGQGIVNQQRMAQQQLGLDENLANAYIADINAHNAARANNMSMATGLISGAMGQF